ncbi:efflux RND transporter periplasmic adaptor subunit [Crateriforma conspicua]|uniref:HlyD family secretion protein n=1 Tax=Crateriforma conspicua TaxID=2527996 RepID=A0A5C6FNY8_9PLAN|nr:efflux RND transporter periplasmic adaptor subunit [Crateriforma conspicua]TWU61801.1 HlyD family secretion protein [Crateriforma conspicua]
MHSVRVPQSTRMGSGEQEGGSSVSQYESITNRSSDAGGRAVPDRSHSGSADATAALDDAVHLLSRLGQAGDSIDPAAVVLADALELQIRLESHRDLHDAMCEAAGWMGRSWAARTVIVGFIDAPESPCRDAIAWHCQTGEDPEERIESKLDSQQDAALDEALRRGEPTWFPPRHSGDRCGALAIERLAKSIDATLLLTVPLVDERLRCCGVVLLVDPSPPDPSICIQNRVDAVAVPLAEKLSQLHRHRPSRLQRWLGDVGKAISGRSGTILWCSVVCVCLLLMIPVPYNIHGQCELLPSGRRFVVAPVDGPLESSRVRRGDSVARGDVLAVINASEMDLELAALEAELARSRKAIDTYLAESKTAQQQLAELEAERFELESQLLRHRRSQLQLTSPIDGVVIRGDLRDAEDAPLTRGQTLFEVAPLGRQRLEIAIPQAEIAYAAAGSTATFRLHAFADRDWMTTVRRIHRTADVKDRENVFIAEAVIDDPEHLLRPGMKGRAWIESGTASLGWVMLHRPIARLRVWLGW